MKTYVFVGHTGQILGREPLSHGDRIELSEEEAQYLIRDQEFPLVTVEAFEARAIPAEVKEDGTV
jgi:hypothetical protein